MLIMIAAVVLLAMTGCDHNRLYETNIPVAGEKWGYDDVKTFTVEIKDTTTRYNIYINLRHSFLFDWRNIYVKIGTQLPDGKKLDKRVNLPLCETDGKWYGSCLGDNCDIPVMIQHDARFPQVGRYTFSIRQDMRVNPLDKIKSVGLRVEKAIVKQQQ
jgi:gliding motility-associated lipoprotein GldH